MDLIMLGGAVAFGVVLGIALMAALVYSGRLDDDQEALLAAQRHGEEAGKAKSRLAYLRLHLRLVRQHDEDERRWRQERAALQGQVVQLQQQLRETETRLTIQRVKSATGGSSNNAA